MDNEYDHIHLITKSELEAAQQLMELSDEENNSNNNISASFMKRKRRRAWDYDEEERVNQRVSNDDIIMAKIQEIFGNDFEAFKPKKQRRYRSLVNIYMTTRPLNAGNGTRVRA
ncbi:hypothetical protein TanjilG_02470 [Lupinus angustifolius]|uniref:Uncharacterized protein n=1 Tax=Lupinus angustifolius TaxID=3871 RepID=A0A1J7IGR3_LUPAN|nr:hypothetical protein TanjilG_02470 [Lupinus angustifolius]